MKIPFPLGAKRPVSTDKPTAGQRGGRSRAIRLILIVAILAAILGAGAYYQYRLNSAAPAAPSTVSVTWGNLAVTVDSSGSVQPAKSVDLSFQASGRIQEILVKSGDRVKAGQPLARVDDNDLRLEVQQAQADVQTAEAKLDQAKNGTSTPEQLAEASAQISAAEAQLAKARSGNVTANDIRAAQAQLEAAQARLDALKNPSADKISAAELKLVQAKTNLEQVRDSKSAVKTKAKLDLDQSVSALTQAQSAYSTALQNWEYVQETGNDPTNPTTTDPTGKKVPNKLSDAQRQQYYDTYVQAEAALHSAEARVTQAQVAYDTARQDEAAAIPDAEAQVADAQKQLDALRNPSASAVREAQAAVNQARAQLDKLRQGGTAADIAAAKAQVEQARANRDQLTAPSASSNIAIAEAGVTQAKAKLAAAQYELENVVLRAPFDGIISTINVVPGAYVNASAGAGGEAGAAFTIIDTATLYLDLKLGESDVMQVKAGQSVDVTFETIPNQVFKGTVESVAPAGKTEQNVTTYAVRVRFDPKSFDIKVGMTGDAQITVQQHENVIQVPNRALQGTGKVRTVQVLYGSNKTPVSVQVETGLSNETSTEIVKCVATNNQCLREGDQLVVNIPNVGGQQDGSGQPQMMELPAPSGGGGGQNLMPRP